MSGNEQGIELSCEVQPPIQSHEQLRAIVKNEPPKTQDHLFNTEHEIAFHGKLYEITGNEAMKKFLPVALSPVIPERSSNK